MKPPSFRYAVPTTIEEAMSLRSEHGDEAKVLAGGQSLVPLMNLRLARPSVLVDINRVAELDYVRGDDGVLRLGALTRHRQVETSGLLAEACPLLVEAARHIGYPAIRNRGTIGGSLANADPLSESPCAAVALDAEVVVSSASGSRTIPASELSETQFVTTLAPEEVVREVVVPRMPSANRWGFREFARKDGDFAIAAVAVVLDRASARPASGSAASRTARSGPRRPRPP